MRNTTENDAVDERELASMLHAYEGPDRPRPPRAARRAPRAKIAIGAAAAAVAAGIGAPLLFDGSSADRSSGCPEELSFDDRPYVGVAVQRAGDVRAAQPLGTAVEGRCADEAGAGPTGGAPLEVHAADGFAIEIALVRLERPEIVYVARGRCANVRGWDGYVGCLRERLDLRGRRYTAVRVSGDLGTPPRQSSSTLAAMLETDSSRRATAVRPLEGVSPARAVSLAHDPRTLFIADGACYVETIEALFGCLGVEG